MEESMGTSQRSNSREDPSDPRVKSSEPELWWSSVRRRYQNFFSEFFGVFILILFGNGSVAQVVLSKNQNGAYQSITWGWG
jgi:aquaglyceroporin related protein